MREILFRGKRLDNQEWVEGNLLLSETPVSGMPLAFITTSFIDNYSLNNYQVDPTTVGQFTGLTDKNGAKIWENDKVCYVNENGTLSLPYEVYYRQDVAAFWMRNLERKSYQTLASQLELIIYPKLAKVKQMY